MSVLSAAVVGGGYIGTSWARLMARSGLDVRLFDPSSEQLSAARDAIEAAREPGDRAARRIRFCDSLVEALDGVEYVQEAVPEILEVKRKVLEEIDAILDPTVAIGSSTSAYKMSELARDVRHADRCLVVHPTNPPHIVPLVEIVPSPATDAELVGRVYAFMLDLGQEPILCNKEIFGFVLNRLQFALLREAFFLVRNGVASVGDVDKTVREGLGLRWAFLGPFGVEATNASSIEDDLHKFGDLMRALFADVCQPFDGPDERDIASVVAGVAEMLGDTTQEEIVAYRDRMLNGLRELKGAERADPFADAQGLR